MIEDPKDNKLIEGKLQMEALPWLAIPEMVKVCEFGVAKYGRHNYLNAAGRVPYWEAAMRHMFAWVQGEDRADDSGRKHLAHAAITLMMLLSMEEVGVPDDRCLGPNAERVRAKHSENPDMIRQLLEAAAEAGMSDAEIEVLIRSIKNRGGVIQWGHGQYPGPAVGEAPGRLVLDPAGFLGGHAPDVRSGPPTPRGAD